MVALLQRNYTDAILAEFKGILMLTINFIKIIQTSKNKFIYQSKHITRIFCIMKTKF